MTDAVFSDPVLPAFSDIRSETIHPQLTAMLKQHLETIESLVKPEQIDWNTLSQPMDNLADQLNKFWSPISHINSVMNSDAMREAYNASIPELSKYATEIGQNRRLFEAYTRLKKSEEYQQLTEAQKKTVDNALRDFHLAGVNLSGGDKTRYREISQRLAELGSKFSDNVLDATKAWSKHFTDATPLAGLPQSALAIARQAGMDRGVDGYVITLDFPSFYPVMTYAEDRELRRQVYEAYVTRASEVGPHGGQFDNSGIINEILQLRLEKAKLLDFQSFAELSLAKKMASTPQEVLDFLNDLAEKSVTPARKEYSELAAFAREQGLETLEAWDVSFYSEKLKQQRFSVSQEALKPYFPVEKVISGMFDIVGRLFGITLEEIEDFDAYHEDLRLFSVKKNGQSVARCYMDLFARENKRGGAWMADYAGRRRLDDGKIQQPVAFITCNFSPPTEQLPSLLTHNEATTLFHEFGHALHHMLTGVDCLDVSGINGVAWDAVELPSQFLENWCWQAEGIALISGHYETGEALPHEMLQKMLAARNFQSAMAMVRQLEFALFDFRLHHEYDGSQDYSVQNLLKAVRERVAVTEAPDFNRFPNSFSHIFAGGYAAGYYSYKWAEVLSSDAFSRFEEQGIFDQQTGREFLQCILEKGGSREPMALFTEFRGRPPSVNALLRHSGIAYRG